MISSINEINSELNNILDLTSEFIKKNYRNKIDYVQKHDKSPVSKIDIGVENIIKDNLIKHFPNCGFWTEESENISVNNEYVWVIDPIDGTRSFISGYPIFCTLIALYKNQKPIWSGINSPITNERWVAYKNKTFFNEEEINCSNQYNKLVDCFLASTTPSMFSDIQFKKINKLQQKVKSYRYGGDAYNYGTLACGYLNLVVEADLKFYDIAPLILIIENAGGIITNWQGNKLTFGSSDEVIAATNKLVYKQALDIIS